MGFLLYEQSYLSVGIGTDCEWGGCIQVRLVVPMEGGGTMAAPARYHRDYKKGEWHQAMREFRTWCKEHRVEPDPNDSERLRPVAAEKHQMELFG